VLEVNKEIIDRIISNAVDHLNTYPFFKATKENIFEHDVYKILFKAQLEFNKGKGFDEEINELLSMIQ
jgi:hypothetical protein